VTFHAKSLTAASVLQPPLPPTPTSSSHAQRRGAQGWRPRQPVAGVRAADNEYTAAVSDRNNRGGRECRCQCGCGRPRQYRKVWICRTSVSGSHEAHDGSWLARSMVFSRSQGARHDAWSEVVRGSHGRPSRLDWVHGPLGTWGAVRALCPPPETT